MSVFFAEAGVVDGNRTVPGSGKFTISDTLTNHGSEPQEFMLIYHANYGLRCWSRAPGWWRSPNVAPFNDHAAKAEDVDTYAAPRSVSWRKCFRFSVRRYDAPPSN